MRTALMVSSVACSAPPPDPGDLECPRFEPGYRAGRVPTPPATELSGIAATSDGRLLVHNDSGESAAVHVLDGEGGWLGTWELTGVEAVDFEDIAVGVSFIGEETAWVGDIGDNLARRQGITVYRFALPASDDGRVEPERIDLVYPDGPRDAEAMWVDHRGTLWIADKQLDGNTGIYRLLDPGPGVSVLERVATLRFGEPPLGQATQVTGGDWGPVGLVLRTYLDVAYVWPAGEDGDVLEALEREPCPVGIVGEGQGEGIGWTDAGLVTVSEGEEPALNVVPLLR